MIEYTLPYEIDPAIYPELLLLIQRAADVPGQASQVGRSLSWGSQHSNGLRQVQVMVNVRSGTTHIWIEERYPGLLGALYGGGLGGFGGGFGGAASGMAATASVALAVALPVAFIGGTYLACRRFYAHHVAKRRRTLEQLLHDILARVAP